MEIIVKTKALATGEKLSWCAHPSPCFLYFECFKNTLVCTEGPFWTCRAHSICINTKSPSLSVYPITGMEPTLPCVNHRIENDRRATPNF